MVSESANSAALRKLCLDFIYHSEALEGSPLTRDEIERAILEMNPQCRQRCRLPADRRSEIDREIYKLLRSFGVQEPALSAMAGDSLPVQWYREWIEYIQSQPGLKNGPGYLVARWKNNDPPPDPRYTGGLYAEYIQS